MNNRGERLHQVPSLPVGFTVIEPKGLREQIIDGAAHDIAATTNVFEIINSGRPNRDRLLVAPVGEQLEWLDDQLTPEALDAAETCLFQEEFSDHPFMVMPALSGPITAEELVRALGESSRYGISPYSGRLAFLGQFAVDTLTGYDPDRAERGALSLVETDYAFLRKGTADEQLARLHETQADFPGIGIAPLLATAALAQRAERAPLSWQKTVTRAIHVTDGNPSQLYIPIAEIGPNAANLDPSPVRIGSGPESPVQVSATVARLELKLAV